MVRLLAAALGFALLAQAPPPPRPVEPPRPMGPSRPMGPPGASAPWNRDLYLAESKDGVRFTRGQRFVERGGVPCVIRDGKGRLAAVFQWFPFERREAFDRVAVCFSTDEGKSWTPPDPVKVEGTPDGYQRPYDPTLALLPDGRLRLYFTSQPSSHQGATYSAISTDGIRYTWEPGVRFRDDREAVVDPSLVRLGDTWHLFAPYPRIPGRAYHATSKDGLSFTRQPEINLSGADSWIGNPAVTDAGVRFYGSGRVAWSATSADGKSWKLESAPHGGGGDPCAVRLKNGGYLMISTGDLRSDLRGPDGSPLRTNAAPAGGADALSTNGEFLYVLRGGRLYQLDARTLKVLREVELPPP